MWPCPYKSWTCLLLAYTLTSVACSLDTSATSSSELTLRSSPPIELDSPFDTGLLEKRRRHRHRKLVRHRTKPKPKPTPTPPKHVQPQNRFSSNLITHVGDATYFSVGLGACGHVNTDDQYIAAASHFLYDSYPGATPNPNNNPICGRRLKARWGGTAIIVTIVDRCQACKEWDLDFSPSAFQQLNDLSAGRLHGMEWEWLAD